MRILVISDIRFSFTLRKKKKVYVKKYFGKDGNSLLNLTDLITDQKIDLVLMAGDVMGDSGDDEYSGVFAWLLDYFEQNKIKCFFISGNHDVGESYTNILKSIVHYKFVKEISGLLVVFRDVRIFGLSYKQTEKLSQLKNFLNQNIVVDILLCHAPNKRRPFLFDFDTKYVLTGHYDVTMGQVEDKIFLALNLGHFAIIDTNNKNHKVEFYLSKSWEDFFNFSPKPSVSVIRNGKLKLSENFNNIFFGNVQTLLSLKREYLQTGTVSKGLKAEYQRQKSFSSIAMKTQIDYLGKRVFELVNSDTV